MLDMRAQSPSHGQRVALSLDSADPKGVLVPFGVACLLDASSPARVIVLSTHSEEHVQDSSLNQDELDNFIRAQ
jgi:hypothetical protein